MITRRRVLTIAAAALAAPAHAALPQEWRGIAMGSAARIVLTGATPERAARVFRKAEAILAQVETQFSLHRDSELTRLNRNGSLSHPPAAMVALFELAGEVHKATQGAFDPTIQPLWLATALRGDVRAASALIGWDRVHFDSREITLEPSMQLTFNGIAQGHAADAIAALMRAEGFGDVLIDMGEIVGLGNRPAGGGWKADVALPDGKAIARVALTDRALSTSSPSGTLIGQGRPHILDPGGRSPRWEIIAVSAASAALADALSTAFCVMDRALIHAALARFPGARLETIA